MADAFPIHKVALPLKLAYLFDTVSMVVAFSHDTVIEYQFDNENVHNVPLVNVLKTRQGELSRLPLSRLKTLTVSRLFCR